MCVSLGSGGGGAPLGLAAQRVFARNARQIHPHTSAALELDAARRCEFLALPPLQKEMSLLLFCVWLNNSAGWRPFKALEQLQQLFLAGRFFFSERRNPQLVHWQATF
jgi:hypothetical protein